MLRRTYALTSIAFALSVLAATDATAGGQRSFVSGSGVDVGTCTPTAPCRGFTYALTQTASGGEIIALDSAGYGIVTITQAVSIIAPSGVYAGISVFAGDGITIDASASDAVTLQGLTLVGLGGSNGIRFTSAASLRIVDCSASGFSTAGLLFNSTLTSARVIVEHSTLSNNAYGAYISPTGNLTIRNSIASGNSASGVYIFGIAGNGGATLTVVESLLEGNNFGLNADTNGGGPSHIRIAGNRITNNTTGLRLGGASDAVSIGNNMIRGNGTEKSGSPTVVAGD